MTVQQKVPDVSGLRAERVVVVSLMKSGTHLVQELMLALGYRIYGQSRIPQEIQPVLDEGTRDRIVRMVHGDQAADALGEQGEEAFRVGSDQAWEALGWAWQQRLGMPLVNRYGARLTQTELVEQAFRRTAGTPFSATPENTCWIIPELDIKKLDGKFVEEWAQTGEPRILFMYRDPRDMVLSMVNFLLGKTVQGFGNFSEFQVFHSILKSKGSLEERLLYALSDPAFPGSGDHERMLWLLNHPNVCSLSFEEMVGPQGGGSAEAQLDVVRRVIEFVGADADPEKTADGIFRRDSFSFFKGQIGSWREAFTPRVERLAHERLAKSLELYGYSA
ncbi:hypothetical protein [Streptomyces sp. NPDC096152]|uniref:hypothetical protein n=1 Tax=Streptomyces sp. NPDC096152 TaxID=3366078 RepID=UPI0038287951